MNANNILETIKMIEEEKLDIRTITMGISLLDCIDSDGDKAREKIYNKITTCAKDLVKVGNEIADRVGITRSVIVNALRKFESAGVIESRSLGMKGTHIKILNDKLIPELKKVKNSN